MTSDNVQSFLALDPKFNIPPSEQDIPIVRLLADVEPAIQKVDIDDRISTRFRVANIITNYVLTNKSLYHPIHLWQKETRKFLKQHPDLLIIPSDKGNATTALDRDKYEKLGGNILSDKKYYKILKGDPTSTIQQKVNQLISKLEAIGKIETKFYGLPKIHKPTLSLRPIISNIGSPTANLSKFLTKILTNAYDKDNPYYIRGSFEFSSFITGYQLPENYNLIILDEHPSSLMQEWYC